jgi:hypothetical protein
MHMFSQEDLQDQIRQLEASLQLSRMNQRDMCNSDAAAARVQERVAAAFSHVDSMYYATSREQENTKQRHEAVKKTTLPVDRTIAVKAFAPS